MKEKYKKVAIFSKRYVIIIPKEDYLLREKRKNMLLEKYNLDEEKNEDEIAKLAKSKLPNLLLVSHLLDVHSEEIKNKIYWYNFAKIIIARGEEEVKDVFTILYFWLRDYNWPGSLQIRDFILKSSRKRFLKGCYDSLILAKEDNDEEWILGILSLLSERPEGSEQLSSLCEYMIESEDFSSQLDEVIKLIERTAFSSRLKDDDEEDPDIADVLK